MIIRQLKWNERGLNVNDENLSHLRFVGDLIVFSESPKTLQHMLQQVSDRSEVAGLAMNLAKTKVMNNSPKPRNFAHKTNVCQNSIERSAIGIKRKGKVRLTDKKENTIYSGLFIISNTEMAMDRTHGKGEQGKWTKIVTELYPRDVKRNKGRRTKRWEDDIKKEAGPEWIRVAKDTKIWKSLEEPFVEKQAVFKPNADTRI
ncbi:uncharacterized protein LOC133319452 [Danaus plexippus]|uniref:uncharacterized protein LOC133319452 n=1 Tax=Danaus plexippus TaxID=13037 RepID=UPI002AB0A041|nr:uncharacterized protein LOC133319452 [Danaus plexippus]